jgi:hypothetical protein
MQKTRWRRPPVIDLGLARTTTHECELLQVSNSLDAERDRLQAVFLFEGPFSSSTMHSGQPQRPGYFTAETTSRCVRELYSS